MLLRWCRKAEIPLLPWAGRDSIYKYIRNNLNADGKLPDGCLALPDDHELAKCKRIRWAPGEGVRTHHATERTPGKKANKIGELVRRQVAEPSNSTRRATYLALMEDDLTVYVDPLLEGLAVQTDTNHKNLYHEAVWFAKEGAHRGVVKMGIALLGLFDCKAQSELLLTLGKHEEFTLYVAIAIQNGMVDANQKLFELAKCVSGWGKIHLVERLMVDGREIRDWLIEDGCRNSVIDEYLAYICATKGGLRDALEKEIVEYRVYQGAGMIIAALIHGDPAGSIDKYEDARPVIVDYLRHARTYCTTLADFLIVASIKKYLEEDTGYWNNRFVSGWDSDARQQCLAACNILFKNKDWSELVREDLKSIDSVKQHNAIQAARILQMDIWPALFRQLTSDPLNQSLYCELMCTKDLQKIKKLVDFAERTLPLESIATGPSDELGLGIEFKPHVCLDHVLQELTRFVGMGQKLVLTALRSPVIRNRSMALRVLSSWDRDYWPREAIGVLLKTVNFEPDREVKRGMNELLKKARKRTSDRD